MKKILFLLLIAPFFLFSQNERVFTGKCAIAQTGGGVSYWQVSVTNFNDPGGLWDATEISEGDKLFFSDGGYPYSLTIDTVLSSIGSVATVRVLKAGVIGISSVPTTSNAFISRGTTNNGLYPWVSNLSGNDNQLAQEYNMVLIGASVNGAKDTLYLPDGTPLVDGDTIPDVSIFNTMDSLTIINGGVKMDSAGQQVLGIGHFENFPDAIDGGQDYGVYISPGYYGGVYLINKNSYMAVSEGFVEMNAINDPNAESCTFSMTPVQPIILTRNAVGGSAFRTYGIAIGDSTSAMANKTGVNFFKRNAAGVYFPQLSLAYNGGNGTSNDVWLYGKYALPNAQPSVASGAKSEFSQAGNGSATTPSFVRKDYGSTSDTTDGSGDITVTCVMPDGTFSAGVTITGTTTYQYTVHTKTSTSFKIRFFNSAGTAVTSTAVTADWQLIDN